MEEKTETQTEQKYAFAADADIYMIKFWSLWCKSMIYL